MARYSEPEQSSIREVFKCLATTRKTGRMSENIKTVELKYWDTHEKWKVMAGIQTYLDKGCHTEGKGENYLRGIIRNARANYPKKTETSDAYKGIRFV